MTRTSQTWRTLVAHRRLWLTGLTLALLIMPAFLLPARQAAARGGSDLHISQIAASRAWISLPMAGQFRLPPPTAQRGKSKPCRAGLMPDVIT